MPVLLPRSVRLFLVSMVVMAACGDDKGGSEGSTSSATPATEATGAGPTEATATDGMTSEPTGDPTSAPGELFCRDECSEDADCFSMGMDYDFTCVDRRCTFPVREGCADDFDCQVMLSGWAVACEAQADCPGQVCVDIGGEGLCATAPSDFLSCDEIFQVEVVLPSFPEGEPLTACANTDYECKDGGVCQNSCESDADCTSFQSQPRCNVGTGICECGSDDDCALSGVPALSVCRDGACGCGTDADCAGDNTDVCNESGACGCSSTAACKQKGFDGTTLVCAAQ